MPSLAFAGDLHASNLVYARHPSVRGDSKFSLQQIAAFCRSRDIPLVLLGDNFDKRSPDADTVASFFTELNDVELAFIVGQHDMQPGVQWPSIAQCKRPRYELKPVSCATVVGGFVLWGFNNLSRAEAQSALANMPAGVDVLCLHQLFPEVMGLEGSWTFDPTWAAEHSSPPKLIVAGDYHGFPNQGVTAGLPWYYTGSMYMRSVSEPASKSFVIAVMDSAGRVVVERVPLVTRPFYSSSVMDDHEFSEWCNSLEQLVTQLRDEVQAKGAPAEVASPFVVLRFSTNLPRVSEIIEARFADLLNKGTFHLHLMPQHVDAPADDLPRVASAVDVQDVIDARVSRESSPQLHHVVTALAMSNDPSDWLSSFKTQQGVLSAPT